MCVANPFLEPFSGSRRSARPSRAILEVAYRMWKGLKQRGKTIAEIIERYPLNPLEARRMAPLPVEEPKKEER
jgi:hypothetical protein